MCVDLGPIENKSLFPAMACRGTGGTFKLELELEKCLLDKHQIQTKNNVINDTFRMFYVGRPLPLA